MNECPLCIQEVYKLYLFYVRVNELLFKSLRKKYNVNSRINLILK